MMPVQWSLKVSFSHILFVKENYRATHIIKGTREFSFIIFLKGQRSRLVNTIDDYNMY